MWPMNSITRPTHIDVYVISPPPRATYTHLFTRATRPSWIPPSLLPLSSLYCAIQKKRLAKGWGVVYWRRIVLNNSYSRSRVPLCIIKWGRSVKSAYSRGSFRILFQHHHRAGLTFFGYFNQYLSLFFYIVFISGWHIIQLKTRFKSIFIIRQTLNDVISNNATWQLSTVFVWHWVGGFSSTDWVSASLIWMTIAAASLMRREMQKSSNKGQQIYDLSLALYWLYL